MGTWVDRANRLRRGTTADVGLRTVLRYDRFYACLRHARQPGSHGALACCDRELHSRRGTGPCLPGLDSM